MRWNKKIIYIIYACFVGQMTEEIPSTMICDNMVSFLMKKKNVDAVIVGADRVTANGDTANKIGTYQVGEYSI